MAQDESHRAVAIQLPIKQLNTMNVKDIELGSTNRENPSRKHLLQLEPLQVHHQPLKWLKNEPKKPKHRAEFGM